ncbi:MAG: hypothetical protein IJP48_08000 [Synergistaceae bacterium]|nr:hypothetical protein [Synergistaceae bacterium]
MAAITDVPIYVTKGELDLRLRNIDDKITHQGTRTDERLISMERLFDEKLARIELIFEKTIANQEKIASDMRAEISDIRGDVKALSAKVDAMQMKFGWYLTLFGVGVGAVLALFQLLIK